MCISSAFSMKWNFTWLISNPRPCAYLTGFFILGSVGRVIALGILVVSSYSTMFSFIIWIIQTCSKLQKSLKHSSDICLSISSSYWLFDRHKTFQTTFSKPTCAISSRLHECSAPRLVVHTVSTIYIYIYSSLILSESWPLNEFYFVSIGSTCMTSTLCLYIAYSVTKL